MKKLKLLPTILMLVLCVGVLAIGIYAITPTKNTISGSITINASNPEMIISVYPLSSEGARGTALYKNVSVRSGMDINLGTSLVLDASSANTTDELKDLTLDFEIEVQNPTSTKMAVYFTTEDKGESVATTDIKTTTSLTTTGDNSNNTLVKANMSGYMAVPAKGTENGVCSATLSFELNDFATTSTAVNLSDPANQIYFCIDEYKTALDSNTITLQTNGNNVTLAGSLVNTLTSATATLNSTTTEWSPTIKFSDAKYKFGSSHTSTWHHVIPTAIVKFTVTNNESYPISVSVNEVKGLSGRSDIKVTALGNSYIPANAEGEVSVQFAYNREAVNNPTTSTLPEDILGISYNIEVQKVSSLTTEDIKARIQYTEQGIANDTLHYYIEYGSHNGTPLRWFIWAKDNGSGTATALAIDDITGTTNGSITVKSNTTYYFISEYVLDVSDTNFGLSWDGEYYQNDGEDIYTFTNGSSRSYDISNLRKYYNGQTVRRQASKYDLNEDGWEFYWYSSGESVNMYDRFGLTNDPLFGAISAREVETGCADKFWALSYDEAFNGVFTTDESRIAYKLSSTSSDCYWCLRSPYGYKYICNVRWDGKEYYSYADSHSTGSRPAFQITI